MKINLEMIRTLLRKTIGFESFIASFVNDIQEDKNEDTASINIKGVIHYNPTFVKDKVKTEADLFCLIFHELLHPTFGHFMRKNDAFTNIACDSIINATITNLFSEPSNNGHLFKELYSKRGVEAILRKGSELQYSQYDELYNYLYPNWRKGPKLSSGEVIQALKMLNPPLGKKILLIGSHNGSGRSSNKDNRWTNELVQKLSADILAALIKGGNGAGRYDNLTSMLIEILTPKKTMRQDLLLKYTTKKKLDNFFDTAKRNRRITSPFPINPSRRDMLMLAAGIWPGLFRNIQPEVIRRQQGIAMFLDVSGSVNKFLPEILGFLAQFKNRIKTIYLFSNKVVEISFTKLCKGEIKTTGGTDFDCIAEKILEAEYERAVIFTDGYASLEDKNAKLLHKNNTKILTILFDGGAGCTDLEPFGEIVQLDDITS